MCGLIKYINHKLQLKNKNLYLLNLFALENKDKY